MKIKSKNFFANFCSLYSVIKFCKQKVNITSFYAKTIIKDVFYHNYSFNTELTLEYVIINIMIKAKRRGSGAGEERGEGGWGVAAVKGGVALDRPYIESRLAFFFFFFC